ncbi:MAG TPA: phage portal protein, partial [Steroidobacteraceae bacterium]
TRTLSESAEMWHLRAPPLDDLALAGRSHLEMSAELLSGALALQDYAARYWLNDGRPPGWIEHPSSFKTAEDRARFMAALKRAHSGRNRHSLGVLEWGMKFKDVGATNESSQFLETMKEKDVALTRLWNVPPHKVGILDRATFSNIEQQSIEFVRDTLGAWLVVWQQSIKVNLIGNRRDARLYCEFDLTDLLRGDLQSRFAAYNQARTGGWMSINDIRRRERMSPIENGDTYLEPLNMRRVGEPGPARIITPEQDRAEPPENGAVPPANGNGARRPNGRGHHA